MIWKTFFQMKLLRCCCVNLPPWNFTEYKKIESTLFFNLYIPECKWNRVLLTNPFFAWFCCSEFETDNRLASLSVSVLLEWSFLGSFVSFPFLSGSVSILEVFSFLVARNFSSACFLWASSCKIISELLFLIDEFYVPLNWFHYYITYI